MHDLESLLAAAVISMKHMTPAQREAEAEAQRRSFAYGNANISNPAVTREMIDEAAREETNK